MFSVHPTRCSINLCCKHEDDFNVPLNYGATTKKPRQKGTVAFRESFGKLGNCGLFSNKVKISVYFIAFRKNSFTSSLKLIIT